jgi:4-coumarate--CoA ligase
MTYALQTAQAKIFMTAPASLEVASEAASKAGIPKDRILLEGTHSGYSTIQDLIRIGKKYGEHGQVPSFQIPSGQKNKDLCGYLSFSSGTTGLPKAVS